MRIAHVTHSFLPNIGGIETHVFELTKELAKKNDVVVYSAADRREDAMLGNVLVRRYPAIKCPFLQSVNFSLPMVCDLAMDDADVIHSHGFFSTYPLFASVIARLKKKTGVYTLHGYPAPKNPAVLALLKCYELAVAPVFLGLSDAIITVSDGMPAGMEKYRGKTKHVPNGVPASFSCRTSFRQEKGILYVGRLAHDKGVETLVRAYLRLGPKAGRLALCGSDAGAKKGLMKMAAGAGGRVAFIEREYARMPETYCGAKLVVLPSKYEGFPMVWVEAISCGRPIFSTRVGGYRQFFSKLFGKNAELFLFDGEDELCRKIERFMARESEYSPIVASARRKLAAEYSWKKIAARTMGIYRNAAKLRR